jgi:hypothetical protein
MAGVGEAWHRKAAEHRRRFRGVVVSAQACFSSADVRARRRKSHTGREGQSCCLPTARSFFADTRGKAARHAQVTPITSHIKAWFTSE